MACVIGADIGSQSVKALVLDEGGRVLASAGAAYAMRHPFAGWAEQDPGDWTDALRTAVRAACAVAGRSDVASLGLACQVDGLVALDASLRPLRPAIIWLDRRAARETASLCAAVGEDELVARTGLVPDASHSGPKAMWLRDAEPDVYRETRWLAPVAAHMTGWLTGAVAQDHANASSTLLYDFRRRAFCEELVDHAGLDLERFPAIAPAASVVGTLRAEAAAELGLPVGCEVIVGTGDEHGAAVGAGALGPGVVVDVTGTAEPVAVPAREPVLDSERLLETHAHAVDGMLFVENPGFVSGGSTRWWAQMQGITQAELFARAAEAPPGCDGALFLPALSGSMAPRWNEAMRGCFAGLAMNHDAGHLARAILEGCAFALRDIVARMDALGLLGDEIRVVGGGARSPLWLQIKADVTGCAVRPVLGDYATSLGAAMLAAVAAGTFPDLDAAAAASVELAPEPVLPRAELAAVYAEAHAAYRRLFDGVEGALA